MEQIPKEELPNLAKALLRLGTNSKLSKALKDKTKSPEKKEEVSKKKLD